MTTSSSRKGKRYGGRAKGTPNKVTSDMRQLISNILSEYSECGMMGSDFKSLEPKDRLVIAERLMQYAIPKLQATTLDVAEGTKTTIEETLIQLSKMPED